MKRTLQFPVKKPHLPSVFVPCEWEHVLLLKTKEVRKNRGLFEISEQRKMENFVTVSPLFELRRLKRVWNATDNTKRHRNVNWQGCTRTRLVTATYQLHCCFKSVYYSCLLSVKNHGMSFRGHVPNNSKILSRRFGQQGQLLPLPGSGYNKFL